MHRDRGTNFVLAELELRHGIMRWNQQNIRNSPCQKGVQWHFNPPSFPRVVAMGSARRSSEKDSAVHSAVLVARPNSG